MRTKTVNVYKFNELSDKAKESALDTVREWQVDYEWWDGVYEDAENVGIKITSFDLDRNRHAEGTFTESATYTAEKIVDEHGKDCETYKTAKVYLDDLKRLQNKYKGYEDDDEYEYQGEKDDLDDEFLKSIIEDYSIMLQKEYEYRLEDEQVIESIEANGYEFTEDGKITR